MPLNVVRATWQAVDPGSALGRLQGTDNVLTVESDLFKSGQELLLHGPGGGVQRTVAAVKADLFFCAMEMPRHHVIGSSHLW
jgi:homoserine dehydrogenase